MSNPNKRKEPHSASDDTNVPWKLCQSSKSGGKSYWFNETTGESRYEVPPEMIWEKHYSRTHKKCYYFNKLSRENIWEPPDVNCQIVVVSEEPYATSATTSSSSSSSSSSAVVIKEPSVIRDMIEKERLQHAIVDPSFPRYISGADLPGLARRLKKEYATKRETSKFKVVFSVPNEETANLTRYFLCVHISYFMHPRNSVPIVFLGRFKKTTF
jgi:hypothetical protein